MGRIPEAALASRAATRIEPLRLGRAAGPFLIVGLAYYLGCLAGFALRFPLSGISFFWPPTAVLTAALLLARPTAWPGLLISALAAHGVAHTMDGVPLGAWLIQFAGNSVQAVVAAFCVNRRTRVAHLFPDVRSAVIFIVCACIGAPAIASLISAAVYVQLGWATDFRGAWLARTITNAVASMTLIPPLFVTGRFLLAPRAAMPARWMEFVLLILGIAGVHAATAFLAQGSVLGLSAALYAPLPFLLWAVVRFGGSGLSFALLWTTLLTITTASRGEGPFVARLSADTVLGVDVFLSGSAVLMMLIAGLLEEQRTERRRLIEAGQQNTAIMARLHEAQQRYELATAAGGVGVWEWNMPEGDLRVEGDLKRMLGYGDDEIRDDFAGWMRSIAPLDRDEIRTRLDALASGASSTFEMEIRMVHRDGSLRWIDSKGAVSSRTDGIPTHATGTYADITDRKESERALRDATDALARTWRISAMTEMSAALAHELNQPLTAITTNTNACLRWIDSGALTCRPEGRPRGRAAGEPASQSHRRKHARHVREPPERIRPSQSQ